MTMVEDIDTFSRKILAEINGPKLRYPDIKVTSTIMGVQIGHTAGMKINIDGTK